MVGGGFRHPRLSVAASTVAGVTTTSGPWSEAYGPRPGTGTQRVLNESWPLLDRCTGQWHARGIPDQPDPIPVTVRVVFETDGEVSLDGLAIRWTKTHVRVSVGDRRLITHGVWVLAEDVRRRPSGPDGATS